MPVMFLPTSPSMDWTYCIHYRRIPRKTASGQIMHPHHACYNSTSGRSQWDRSLQLRRHPLLFWKRQHKLQFWVCNNPGQKDIYLERKDPTPPLYVFLFLKTQLQQILKVAALFPSSMPLFVFLFLNFRPLYVRASSQVRSLPGNEKDESGRRTPLHLSPRGWGQLKVWNLDPDPNSGPGSVPLSLVTLT